MSGSKYPIFSSNILAKYSATSQKEKCKISNVSIWNRNTFIESDSVISLTRVRGGPPLAESMTNRKRRRDPEFDSCETKRLRPNGC